ncbi:MAG: adenylosuccinate lyase [Deltaproteobacteria bacterium]|nr:adenylosuccinate lyase [Deltaproteobacteria bacterium]
MIPRYSREIMTSLWGHEKRFQTWLDIEILACEALAELGAVPKPALQKIKERAGFDIGRIDEIEREVKHDVIAFLTSVAEKVGEEGRYIHMGLTSSDILDTSFAVLLKEAADILIDDLDGLIDVIRRRALEHKETVMIGRSHGIHAEPITFGLKLAVWHQEMQRNRNRLLRAKEIISYGKISGAVGTFSFVDPFVERYVCEKLGLKPAPASTQIIQRDRHAEYFTTLAIIASSVEKIATEIRLLQRTEVREAEEYFSPGQKGSSAMPHKRNPILSENLSGLARLMRSYALVSLEDITLWHERDISHSSAERLIGPDSTILLDFMLYRITNLIGRLVVNKERMLSNLDMTHGVIFSQLVLLKLIETGMSREDAYRIVQKNAMTAWEEARDFKGLLFDDADVSKRLTKGEIESVFDVRNFLGNVDCIFQRVFGGDDNAK